MRRAAVAARFAARLLTVAVFGITAACSGAPASAPNEVQAAAPSDEMGEAHDQSAFGKDPRETHLMSPDEPDLHPQPEPPRDETR